jgi:integrase
MLCSLLIMAASKEPGRTFYGLAAETGLSPGELCGLKVDDLDLERGCCKCTRALGEESWAL